MTEAGVRTSFGKLSERSIGVRKADRTSPLEQFQDAVANRHQYAKEWKARTGGKVLGYFCTYVPEELAYAAGILPVRVLGGHEPQDVTEPYLYAMYCPFSRDCLAQALTGKYDYVDGIAIARSCVHIYQSFDSWQRHLPVSYSYFLSMPSRLTIPSARPFLVAELKRFQQSLEEWTGQPVTDEALDRAIEVYNTSRRRLRQLYELRKADNPSVSGSEAMEVVLSSMLMDKAEHNRWLESFLAQIPSVGDNGHPGVRLMVVGMEEDNLELLRLVERVGAQVVVDDHCTGTRYFWNEVSPGEDRLASLAQRLLDKPACPQKDVVERRRWPHLLGLAQDYRVQGALLVYQKFCDAHQWDNPILQRLFGEQGIPTLSLELETTFTPGQFQTRLEAFIEMLQTEV